MSHRKPLQSVVELDAVPDGPALVWRDVTSYPLDAHNRPTWQARFYALRVTVHQHLDGGWLLSTGPDFFTSTTLEAKDLDAAKAEALGHVEDRLRLILGEVEKAKAVPTKKGT